ncbi:hypothetical protein GCM10023149_31570 [Mucilaginibacter gynuensis]|uniref:Glycosyltransferase involved in cell wall biosynthesis n=1 Tax=Mucilaginibacter gynuensis TaxID=1302236 RepID=A0ABP8GNZ5_9SPHI
MKKTKVVFFADILENEHDGATRTMFQLIKRIDADKFEYLFVCGVGPDRVQGFECIKVPAFTVPVNTSYKMAFPKLVQYSLREKLHEFAPDVVHIATPSLLGEFAVKHAKQTGLPVISIYHTHFVSYIDYYLKNAPFLIDYVKSKVIEGQKAFYNQCDVIYVPSESMANELMDWGVSPLRIQLWKRGIDTELFSPSRKDPYLMPRLTGNNYPTILFASRLVWEKNLETLFRIYDDLQLKNIPFNLIVAGDGVAKKACEARMSKALFVGKVSHGVLAEMYASADAFLFTSVTETYGNVVLEAMASGLPCVIADGGGSADFVENGVNGFKCEPYNEYAYTEKLAMLLTDDSLADVFIGEGLNYSKQFDWNQLAEVYFTDIKRLARHEMAEELAY